MTTSETRQRSASWDAKLKRRPEPPKQSVEEASTRLDDLDRAALRKLDEDFTFNANNEVAMVEGEMRVEVTRLDDRLQLTVRFPNNETLDVRIARSQLLEQLDVEADES